MKKIVIYAIIVGFLASCSSSYQGSSQTWLPRQHKKVDFNKPPKRPR